MLVIAVLVFPAVAAQADSDGGAAGPYEIRLSWSAGVYDEVTVTWMEPSGIKSAEVEYSRGTSLSSAPQTSEGKIQERASGIEEDAVQFSAQMTGLESGGQYVYRIHDSAGNVSSVIDFTVPEDGDSVTFGYFGDVQVAEKAEPEYEKWGALTVKAYEDNPDMSFGIMGGDIVESGISTAQFNLFFKAAESVFSHIPLMAANGNHECNFLSGRPELYLDEFSLPQNGPDGFKEEFYSFDAGPCHVTVLDSWVYSGEQKITDEQYREIADWIDSDLRSTDAVWKVIVMHHPVYPVASDNVSDAVRENWAPIFEKDGVSLILCGHQHVYARSYPMTDGRTDYENGITQVMGVSGSKFYSSADETHMEKTIYNTSNYQIIRINGNEMTIQCFDEDGNELDYASLTPNEVKDEPDSAFSDVDDGDWFAQAVSWAVSAKIISGIGDGLFAPDQDMTRAMFVTVLSRLAGADTSGYQSSSFSDVPAGQWYAGAAEWAAENGIVSGIDDSTFDPDGIITREQMAVILYRYARFENSDTSVNDSPEYAAFSDADDVSPWAEDAVKWAVNSGIINGTGEKTLSPQGVSTRAQAVQVLMNYAA